MPNSGSDSTEDKDLANIGMMFTIVSGVVALAMAFFVWYRWDSTDKAASKESTDSSGDQSEGEEEPKKPNPFRKAATKPSKWKTDKVRDIAYEHPWLIATLKGHLSRVLDVDFATNGKFLVSASEDRSLFLWYLKDFTEREHKFARGTVELDNARRIAFAPDSKSVVVSLSVANKLAVYKVSRREDSAHGYRFTVVDSVDFPCPHTNDINGVGIACNGRFVMSSSEDSKLVVYTLRGEILKMVEPKLNLLYDALVSPCGRFIAASGFTPDVFVFEVLFDRQGNFVDVKRAFDLKGHTSGVLSFGFNQNSSRCVTASKDGTWKVFDTDIRYSQGEEAKVIGGGEWDLLKNASPDSVSVAVSLSGNSCAIGASRHLQLFSTLQPSKQFNLMLDVHQEPLRRVRMSACGKMVATCGDRHIRVFHNVAEYFGAIVALEKAVGEIREETQKRRVQEQLDDARKEYAKVIGTN